MRGQNISGGGKNFRLGALPWEDPAVFRRFFARAPYRITRLRGGSGGTPDKRRAAGEKMPICDQTIARKRLQIARNHGQNCAKTPAKKWLVRGQKQHFAAQNRPLCRFIGRLGETALPALWALCRARTSGKVLCRSPNPSPGRGYSTRTPCVSGSSRGPLSEMPCF